MREKQLVTVVLTGASSGIGAAAALALASAGCRVIGIGRNRARLKSVIDALRPTRLANEPHLMIASDLSELDNVRSLAAEIMDVAPRLDVLVHNAAVQPRKRQNTVDGIELTLAVNHIAAFELTRLLEPSLLQSRARVVITASSDHLDATPQFDDFQGVASWSTMSTYARTKLYNVLFAAGYRERGTVPITCFHPGDIRTALNREAPLSWLTRPFERLIYREPRRGAETLVWLALSDEGASPTALYYQDRAPAKHSPLADDPSVTTRLWQLSDRLVASATA